MDLNYLANSLAVRCGHLRFIVRVVGSGTPSIPARKAQLEGLYAHTEVEHRYLRRGCVMRLAVRPDVWGA